MAVDANKLAACKSYMRVEGSDEDAVIEALYEAAQLYLENAGVREPETYSALYSLAVWSLTLHYYDHRDAVGSEAGIPTQLRPIIDQLKLVAEAGSAAET